MTSCVRLRPDVVFEPLIDGWFAWAHLVSPLTASMNIVERHFKLMESFVAAASMHAAANRDPRLRGGKFLDVAVDRVDEIRTLLAETRRKRTDVVTLHDAIEACFRNLRTKAQGYPMEPLYQATPEPLRGCVEYVYDISGRPDVHFFEPLIYRSRYYDSSMQSVLIRRIRADRREFIMSTPRLSNDGDVRWMTDFSSAAIDRFARLRHLGTSWRALERELEEARLPVDQMKPFFWETSSPNPGDRREGAARWKYFGHACLLLEADGATILVDPFIAYGVESGVPRFGLGDLPEKIDAVLITHNHSDHINIETLLALRERIGLIVVPESGGRLQDPCLKLMLNAIGFRNVRVVSPFESLGFGHALITALPFLGEHADLDIRAKSAYHIAMPGWSSMCVADSANLDPALYERIREVLGPVHTLFVGMECEGAPLSWVYGPLLCGAIERAKDNSRRLAGSNDTQAGRMLDSLGCNEAFVYAMGQEPWVQFVTSVTGDQDSAPGRAADRFVAACRQRGVRSRRLFGKDWSEYPCA